MGRVAQRDSGPEPQFGARSQWLAVVDAIGPQQAVASPQDIEIQRADGTPSPRQIVADREPADRAAADVGEAGQFIGLG